MAIFSRIHQSRWREMQCPTSCIRHRGSWQVSICLPILRLARPHGIIFYCHYPAAGHVDRNIFGNGIWCICDVGTLGTLGYGFEDVWRCWKPWQNFHFAEDYLLTTKSSVCLGGWHGFLGSGCGPSCEAPQALPLNYSQSSQAPQMKTWSGLWWAYVYIYVYTYIYIFMLRARWKKIRELNMTKQWACPIPFFAP